MSSEKLTYEILIIVTSILIISSTPFKSSLKTFFISKSINCNQYSVSSASLSEIPSLFLKSLVLTPRCAYFMLAPMDVPLLNTCLVIL